MSQPPPPADNEQRNIIDKLAAFIARNGPQAEEMTRRKQANNPKFAFLYGGPYLAYYQFRVATEQACEFFALFSAALVEISLQSSGEQNAILSSRRIVAGLM